MMATLVRRVSTYGALAATVPKMFLAYSLWFWVGLLLNTIGMMVFVYFWRAVYADTRVIAGLTLAQTLSYIMLARIFEPLGNLNMIFEFGYNLREGGIAHVLLRPVDIQASYYVVLFTDTLVNLIWQVPVALVATLGFGLRWPADPSVWGAFLISAVLGRTVLFFFDWILGCLTFYTTEVWGLGVLVYGIGLFLSGGLVPLPMMPDWLRLLVQSLPFAQSIYVPISILSGVTPLADAPRLWLGQLAWIIGLGVASRAFFAVAIRKVTVQGG
jgi:ABC-2 type transport system permease protein